MLSLPPYTLSMVKAMFSLAYFGFLRPGEICKSPHTLQLSQVQVFSAKLVIEFSTFKNSRGKPIYLTIPRKFDFYCPVHALSRFLRCRGPQEGALFCDTLGKEISPFQFSKFLKMAVIAAGLPGKFSGHCFRIGAATQAAMDGMPDHVIQRLGRWRSLAWLVYVRRANIKNLLK